MKGIRIREDANGVRCELFVDKPFSDPIVEKVKIAKCSPDDTYDFETGALIALMKMCGLEKSAKAYAEIFDVNVYGDALIERDKLERKNRYLIDDINTKLGYLKEKDEEIEKLKKEKEQIIVAKSILNNKLIKENSNLSYIKSCNESAQKKVDAAYKEAYGTTLPVWQKEFYKESKEKTELPKTLDINGTVYRKSIQIKDFGEQINKLTVDSLIEENRAFTRKCVDEWLYKIPTKREKMWDRIIKLHKTNDVIIKVKKEDVDIFLHEIENKIPEITWLSTVKIFETKYTIKDIYKELKTCDVIYFRLSKLNTLSYSSDLHIYPYRELKCIEYLPPMRWDLFKKGRLAVKVTLENYKEFYEACKKELGKRPLTVFLYTYTVSICKKDGPFEIFTVEDQKKTGRKIVDWEDAK